MDHAYTMQIITCKYTYTYIFFLICFISFCTHAHMHTLILCLFYSFHILYNIFISVKPYFKGICWGIIYYLVGSYTPVVRKLFRSRGATGNRQVKFVWRKSHSYGVTVKTNKTWQSLSWMLSILYHHCSL